MRRIFYSPIESPYRIVPTKRNQGEGMSFVKSLAGAVLILTCTQGCIVSRANIGEPIQEEALARITKGVTPMAEVVSLLIGQ